MPQLYYLHDTRYPNKINIDVPFNKENGQLKCNELNEFVWRRKVDARIFGAGLLHGPFNPQIQNRPFVLIPVKEKRVSYGR
jgi:hypothetical protein